jgi:hypothetical protein
MTPSMPDPRGLLLRTGIAAAAGAFIVFCVVLPAEYRKDPTGFGSLTGLLELSKPRATPSAQVADAPTAQPSASVSAPTMNAWFFPAVYKTDTIVVPIKGDGEVEYKIRMKAGQAVVYSWLSDKGNVYYDFHGEPENNPKGSVTYKKDEEIRSANGAFVAPFAGIHGWYWLNLEKDPIKITLKISGFYESHDYVR